MAAVKITARASVRVVYVNGVELQFDGNDEHVVELRMGEHVLQWFVRGNKGSNYALAVARPPDAQKPLVEIKGTLDSSRRDAGTYWFVV
jgi:hypothetical protein